MLKPLGYENVQAYGEYEPLELGGHICKIIKVEETESKKGNPMLKIYLDIADGRQAGYYQRKYDRDKRTPKKWGCIVYQLEMDTEGFAHRGLKTFISSVEKSNSGFQVAWSDNKTVFESCFKGKLVGGVFGREQFPKDDGSYGWAIKCQYFRSVEAIREGVEVPEDKPYQETPPLSQFDGFAPMASQNEDDLPF